MEGKIKFLIKEFSPPEQIPFGDETRYRVVRVFDGKVEIIGQYEPIQNFERGMGRVIVKKEGEVVEKEIVDDYNWKTHLYRCIEFFNGRCENPAPLKKAVDIVKFFDYLLNEGIKRVGKL
jgi:hypothetical protein